MKTLLTILIDSGALYDVVPRSYSGKGMYGRECTAISGRDEDVHRTLLEVQRAIVDEVYFAAVGGTIEQARATRILAHEYLEILNDMETDQLGKGNVYYWTDLPFEKPEEFEEENEE